jgi:hypothetical protein
MRIYAEKPEQIRASSPPPTTSAVKPPAGGRRADASPLLRRAAALARLAHASGRAPVRGRLAGEVEEERLQARGPSPSSRKIFAGAADAGLPSVVRGRIPPPTDPIHGPLLDQYSGETGLPRDRVTQHDRGYEAWLAGQRPELNVTLEMNLPAVPAPDLSRDETQLRAWEEANFIVVPRPFFVCDHVVNGGVEESFVTDVGVHFTQATFEFFIARHLNENRHDASLPRDVRLTWMRIFERVRQHALEHFARYRRVVEATRTALEQRFAALPTRSRRVRLTQRELESYMLDLLTHLSARLQFDLWQTTCDWEREDYPRLLRGISGVSGTFRPACAPRPTVPPEPIMVTASPPARPRGRGTRP